MLVLEKKHDFMADSRGKVKLKSDASTPDQQHFPVGFLPLNNKLQIAVWILCIH